MYLVYVKSCIIPTEHPIKRLRENSIYLLLYMYSVRNNNRNKCVPRKSGRDKRDKESETKRTRKEEYKNTYPYDYPQRYNSKMCMLTQHSTNIRLLPLPPCICTAKLGETQVKRRQLYWCRCLCFISIMNERDSHFTYTTHGT